MKMWILCVVLPLTGIGQTNWEQLVQPSSVLQFKMSVADPFSRATSCGNLAFIDSSSIGISIDNKYSLKNFSKLNFGSQLKTNNGGWGFHASCMGNEMFNGASFSSSYGIHLSKTFGFGLGMRFRRDQLKGFSPLYIMIPQLGILYLFSKKMSVGFQIRKFFSMPYKSESLYKEFSSINTGIGYQLDENFYVSAEISNQFRQKATLNIYAEWMPVNTLKTFLMYQHAYTEILGGMHFKIKKMNIGFGASHHNFLGNSGYLLMYHVL